MRRYKKKYLRINRIANSGVKSLQQKHTDPSHPVTGDLHYQILPFNSLNLEMWISREMKLMGRVNRHLVSFNF